MSFGEVSKILGIYKKPCTFKAGLSISKKNVLFASIKALEK